MDIQYTALGDFMLLCLGEYSTILVLSRFSLTNGSNLGVRMELRVKYLHRVKLGTQKRMVTNMLRTALFGTPDLQCRTNDCCSCF